jgi:hypothetical protein
LDRPKANKKYQKAENKHPLNIRGVSNGAGFFGKFLLKNH